MNKNNIGILSILMVVVLIGCTTGEANKLASSKVGINKVIPRLNLTNQTAVKTNVTSNNSIMNATMNLSKMNISLPRINFSRMNLTGNATSFNATLNTSYMNVSGNRSNVSVNVTNNGTNSTR